jgi:hypothetical protein
MSLSSRSSDDIVPVEGALGSLLLPWATGFNVGKTHREGGETSQTGQSEFPVSFVANTLFLSTTKYDIDV